MTVLLDILEVIPIPRLVHALPGMPASELKRRAELMVRLEGLWNREVIIPKRVSCHKIDLEVDRIEILPGGDWVLKLLNDGTLYLHHRQDMERPSVTVHRLTRKSCTYLPESTDMRRSFFTCGDTWVVVLEQYATSEGEQYTDLRVYHIDASPSIHYLTTITKRSHLWDFQAKDDVLTIAGEDQGIYCVTVRKISRFEGIVNQEIVLNLGSEFLDLCPRTSLLCSHMFVVSSALGLRLYKIPELGPTCEDGASNVQYVTPLANEGFGQSIRRFLCAHHDGHVSAYSSSFGNEALIVLPPLAQAGDKMLVHWIDGPCSRTASRAILCKDYCDMEPIKLQSLVHCTRPGTHAGYTRLGQSYAPDPSRCSSISLMGYNGCTEDLSWDPESGRICVLFTLPGESGRCRNMAVVDVL